MIRRRSSPTTLSRNGRCAVPMFTADSSCRLLHTVSGWVSLDRKPIYAPRGVVATSQPLAASAGLDVLRRGGNAVDAAVATAITLTVVQPGSNDIGGDLFAIVWDGTALHGLNASRRSPSALTLDRIGGAMPARGWLPVTVPGAPAGWRDLHSRL